jgi:hypothetical protein
MAIVTKVPNYRMMKIDGLKTCSGCKEVKSESSKDEKYNANDDDNNEDPQSAEG